MSSTVMDMVDERRIYRTCTLAYVHLDTDGDGSYEHLFNEDLIVLGLARTTTFSHTYRRRFERLREETEERGTGLWSACPDATSY